MWGVKSVPPDRANFWLSQGWEPFAVTQPPGTAMTPCPSPVMWLRKQTPDEVNALWPDQLQ